MKRFSLLIYTIILGILLASCASSPYAKTNKVYKKRAKLYANSLRDLPLQDTKVDTTLRYGKYQVGTTNFNLRKPNYVVIHHTAQHSTDQTLTTFTLDRTQVSSHYVIGDNGEIFHMLNDYYRAWHGGAGKWGHNTDLNSSSIGIELDNDGSEPFSDAQIASLLDLLKVLKERYNIPSANFIGHLDIAPGRKVDPSEKFPWKKLADEEYGLWYDEAVVANLEFEQEFFKPSPFTVPFQQKWTTRIPFLDRLVFPEVIPANFNIKEALRIIGYNTDNLKAAQQSFKIHFRQKNDGPLLDDEDVKVLYNLYQKYL